ncbi:MAG: TlpA disulfide reductase family protein [Sphingobium sp.]|nr:TlpA disulfide reductase family protein [Sphingobium sp.]
MTLLLTGGLATMMLAGCDRQSPPPGQGNVTASGEVPPGASGAASGAARGEGGFSYRVDRSKAGEAAPSFTFAAPGGDDATLQDFAGKALLVNLWATWCAPCVAEMPTLDAVAADHGQGDLAVVAISQDTQGEKLVPAFFRKHDLPHLKGWMDPDNQFGFHYATGQLPATILYDRQGKEVARVIGAMDWKGEEARKLIAEALRS